MIAVEFCYSFSRVRAVPAEKDQVYLEGRPAAVPASQLEVGDRLLCDLARRFELFSCFEICMPKASRDTKGKHLFVRISICVFQFLLQNPVLPRLGSLPHAQTCWNQKWFGLRNAWKADTEVTTTWLEAFDLWM